MGSNGGIISPPGAKSINFQGQNTLAPNNGSAVIPLNS
jgi:hypothetical protein